MDSPASADTSRKTEEIETKSNTEAISPVIPVMDENNTPSGEVHTTATPDQSTINENETVPSEVVQAIAPPPTIANTPTAQSSETSSISATEESLRPSGDDVNSGSQPFVYDSMHNYDARLRDAGIATDPASVPIANTESFPFEEFETEAQGATETHNGDKGTMTTTEQIINAAIEAATERLLQKPLITITDTTLSQVGQVNTGGTLSALASSRHPVPQISNTPGDTSGEFARGLSLRLNPHSSVTYPGATSSRVDEIGAGPDQRLVFSWEASRLEDDERFQIMQGPIHITDLIDQFLFTPRLSSPPTPVLDDIVDGEEVDNAYRSETRGLRSQNRRLQLAFESQHQGDLLGAQRRLRDRRARAIRRSDPLSDLSDVPSEISQDEWSTSSMRRVGFLPRFDDLRYERTDETLPVAPVRFEGDPPEIPFHSRGTLIRSKDYRGVEGSRQLPDTSSGSLETNPQPSNESDSAEEVQVITTVQQPKTTHGEIQIPEEPSNAGIATRLDLNSFVVRVPGEPSKDDEVENAGGHADESSECPNLAQANEANETSQPDHEIPEADDGQSSKATVEDGALTSAYTDNQTKPTIPQMADTPAQLPRSPIRNTPQKTTITYPGTHDDATASNISPVFRPPRSTPPKPAYDPTKSMTSPLYNPTRAGSISSGTLVYDTGTPTRGRGQAYIMEEITRRYANETRPENRNLNSSIYTQPVRETVQEFRSDDQVRGSHAPQQVADRVVVTVEELQDPTVFMKIDDGYKRLEDGKEYDSDGQERSEEE